MRKPYLLSEIVVPEDKTPDDLSFLDQPFVLVAPEDATEDERALVERANSMLQKCGILKVGDIVNTDGLHLRVLIGSKLFSSVCDHMYSLELQQQGVQLA